MFNLFHYTAVFFIISLIQAPNALGAVLTITESFYFPGDQGITLAASENGRLAFVGGSNGITTYLFVEPQEPTLTVTFIDAPNFAEVIAPVGPTFIDSVSCNIRGTQAVCLQVDSNPQNGAAASKTFTESVNSVPLLVVGLPDTSTPPPPSPPPQTQPQAAPTSRSPTPSPSTPNGNGQQAPPAASTTGATPPSQTNAGSSSSSSTTSPSSPSSVPSSPSSPSVPSSPSSNSSASGGTQFNSTSPTDGTSGDQGFIPAGKSPSRASITSAPTSVVIYVLFIGISAYISWF